MQGRKRALYKPSIKGFCFRVLPLNSVFCQFKILHAAVTEQFYCKAYEVIKGRSQEDILFSVYKQVFHLIFLCMNPIPNSAKALKLTHYPAALGSNQELTGAH